MLPAVSLAQFYAGDLGDRIAFMRRLERTGEQRRGTSLNVARNGAGAFLRPVADDLSLLLQ
jgi:hypothetical protein